MMMTVIIITGQVGDVFVYLRRYKNKAVPKHIASSSQPIIITTNRTLTDRNTEHLGGTRAGLSPAPGRQAKTGE